MLKKAAFLNRKSLALAPRFGKPRTFAGCLTGRQMPKRPNPRAVKAARTYTIQEGAEALGVTVGSVRAWVRLGLPVMKAQRPFLILGSNLRQFLEDRNRKGKAPLGPDQLYCLTCKQGRSPFGMMVDCLPQTAKTSRLVGLCRVCGGTCNRMISRANLGSVGGIFDVACPDHR